MKFDIVIIGGGLVGASLALALKNSGLKIALVESRSPAPLPDDKSWDSQNLRRQPGQRQLSARPWRMARGGRGQDYARL